MKYNKMYMQKILNDPLPQLPEDERIYLNVQYNNRSFAKITNCRFDGERKLWFTGPRNSYIESLIKVYGINEATSEKAIQLLNEKTEDNDLSDE